ncbi:ABC-2 family transporter protein [Gottschalkia purinilytica]|uniref:ABC-2 family transporter protein n=1 Tax=Gottschalkia purinilytica TaxID=1503 RepID=A0A0L0W8M5_GOTPU|nr:hypothetical protein [Gottschalkia purinilytica]KNF07918.1 ABC-2 family transporter protein [Gottschalkia purinilytica]
MRDFLKYDIKGNYKSFSLIYIATIIFNILILTRLGKWHPGAVIASTFGLAVISLAIITIFNISSYYKELYSDRSYLTFTLPIKGSSVLASKLILSIFLIVLSYIITLVFGYLLVSSDTINNIMPGVKNIVTLKMLIMLSIFAIIQELPFLMQVFFAITITKASIARNRKIGKGLAFIIFFVINIGVSYLNSLIVKAFPKTIEFGDALKSLIGKGMDSNIIFKVAEINIASTIFGIIVFVVLFAVSSYLLNDKIELS